VPIPNLLHPVNITIERLNRGGTAFDEDVGEPIQSAARHTSATCPGQVKWLSAKDLAMPRGGPVEHADGYVLFRYVDLRERGITELAINDRFTALGSTTREVYITKLEPQGHYPDQEGPTLVKAWFRDRSPAKTRG
jgi:hypothetical protein